MLTQMGQSCRDILDSNVHIDSLRSRLQHYDTLPIFSQLSALLSLKLPTIIFFLFGEPSWISSTATERHFGEKTKNRSRPFSLSVHNPDSTASTAHSARTSSKASTRRSERDNASKQTELVRASPSSSIYYSSLVFSKRTKKSNSARPIKTYLVHTWYYTSIHKAA